MSHSVTITRTTTTTTGNVFVVNGNYLCTRPGVLKLVQLLLGGVCVGLTSYYYPVRKEQLFFLLVAVAFLIGTFCLLASCVASLSTGSIIAKTIYEVIYHGLAFILYLAASITLLVEANRYKNNYYRQNNYGHYYESMLAASIIGLILSALYLLSTFLANRTYRGI